MNLWLAAGIGGQREWAVQPDGDLEVRAVPAPLSRMAARLLRRAQAESRAGDSVSAVLTMTSARSLAPSHPDILRWSGIVAQNAGDNCGAVEWFRHAVAALPDDVALHVGLGVALYRLDRPGEAIESLRRAATLDPGSVAAWYNLAEALKSLSQTSGAAAALRRVLEIDPRYLPALLELAEVDASQGRTDEAVAGLRLVLRYDPANAQAWFSLADLKVVHFDRDDLAQLQRALARPVIPPGDRVRLEFALALALEDHGYYGRSFALLRHANIEQRTLNRTFWDGPGEHRRIEAILEEFRNSVAQAEDGELGKEVAFIASLPRSGSTLVEQILVSHRDMEGANEIRDLSELIDATAVGDGRRFPFWVSAMDAEGWQRLGEAYLARTTPWRSAKPRFTDKNLLNWMLAGAALSMLPGARVVVVRRDPVETCLACFRQGFDHGAEFSNDLDETADVYVDFWRLTRFWLQRFPERVFDLEYEKLVAEPEPTIRRLLDFLGLPFDPACLEFYKTPRTVMSAPSAAQVRQPLHNTARAARYGHLLDGLRQRLRAGGLDVPDFE